MLLAQASGEQQLGISFDENDKQDPGKALGRRKRKSVWDDEDDDEGRY